MTRLAIDGNDRFVIDEREIGRDGPTYTVDTLETLRAEGHGDIVLLLGQDAVADMPNWKQPERIRELATIAVAAKPLVAGATGRAVNNGGGDPVVDMPPLAVSSTLIRERVREGKPIRYLVPDAVERYIAEHGLYGSGRTP